MTSRYCEEQSKQPPANSCSQISHASKSHRETIELDSGSPGVASSRCKRRGRRNEGEIRSTRISTFRREEPAPMTLPEKSIDRWSRCNQDVCLDDTEIAAECLNELSNIFRKYFEIKYYLLLIHVSSLYSYKFLT